MTKTEKIEDVASTLYYQWIITDALKNDDNPDIDNYMRVIEKIRNIEAIYTEQEIIDNNLLCDIW